MKAFQDYFPPLYLLLNGILYGVVAWLYLSDPARTQAFLSVRATGPAGEVELQTVYIGLMAALGVFLTLASAVSSLRTGALLFCLLSYAGLAGVRGWGLWAGGLEDMALRNLLLVEGIAFLGAAVGLWCLYGIRRRGRNPYRL